MDLCLGPRGIIVLLRMDIWDCIRASLRASLFLFFFSSFLSPPLFLSISSPVNIYPRTQRLGFSYLRTNTHIQIYKRVVRICLLISACILRWSPLKATVERPQNQISNPFGKLQPRWARCKISWCSDDFIMLYQSNYFYFVDNITVWKIIIKAKHSHIFLATNNINNY